jgi:hypothetical protein
VVVDTIIESTWRFYPAALVMALGALILVRGLRGEWRAFAMPARHDLKGVAIVRAMRLSILGICLLTFGAAWAGQVVWLAVLAAIIAGEEMWETSLMIDGLTNGKRLRLRP